MTFHHDHAAPHFDPASQHNVIIELGMGDILLLY